MVITRKNYYGPKADAEYMSNSQYKAWMTCPAKKWAEMHGKWTESEPIAFTIGKYVDTALLTPGELDTFVDLNRPALFTSRGDKPRAETMRADKMIERVQRDDGDFKSALDGDTQTLITWNMFGVKWRALLDVVDFERGLVTDLKTCKDFGQVWHEPTRQKVPFYEAYGYWAQLAIYREAYKSKAGEYPKAVTIAAVTKEEYPRLKVIVFDNDERFRHELEKIEMNLPDVIKWRQAKSVDGLPRCGACNYCADTGNPSMELAESLIWI